MKKVLGISTVISIMVLLGVYGCGYTRHAGLPENYKTIFVDTVKNSGELKDLYIYIQGFEILITNELIQRLNQDGNLRVVQDRTQADLILDSTLVRLDQEGTRFSNLESVEEFRMFPVMDVKLINAKSKETIWHEPDFTGNADYFVSQVRNLSRQEASERAAKNLAKNIVDRIVEDW